MSASETNLQEGASSFGITLQTKPHHRTKEEEIIFVLNQIRFKTKTVLETLKQIKEKKFDRENQTIYFEELDKKVVNISETAFDKLIAYVKTITENNQILPDLSHSHALNHHFSRAFGQQFTGQRNAFRENPELVNRLVSFFPSGSYESIYIPDCSLDSNIYLLIIFTLIEEYLFLNSDSASSKKEERQITPTFDTFGDELPLQQISFLNPTFNSVIVHISEQKESIVGASVYILMLSDVMENIEQLSPLVQNSLGFDFSEPSNAKKKTMKKMQTTGDLRRPMTTELKSTRIVNPPKYDHVSHTSQIPDFTRDIVRSFIRKIDSNNDDKIDAYDLIKFCKIKNLVLEDKAMYELIDSITNKRQVRLESERNKPVDELEIYNEVRLKRVKGLNGWELKPGPHRSTWVTLFELAGEPLPKNQIPPPKSQPIQAQYQTDSFSRLPTLNKTTSSLTVKELKPKVYQHKYTPEAGIVIQNTQNIRELYNEEPSLQEKKVTPYEQVVNMKFKDVSQTSEYETIQFTTKKYYEEALRLTSDPRLVQNKETNPIYRFVPVTENFVASDSRKVSTSGGIGVEKTGENDSDSFDEDMQPLEADEIKRLQSSRFGSVLSIRKGPSSQNDYIQYAKIGQVKPMSQQSTKKTLERPMTQQSFKKVADYQPSSRPITRTTRDTFHPVDMYNEPVFCTTFKLPSKFDLKKEAAANNPTIKDPYNPPELHKFRDDVPPTDKPHFKVASKANFYKDKAQVIAEASQPIPISKKEEARMFYENMKLAEKEEQLGKLPEWRRYFKHASRERGFLDFQYPTVLKKGNYIEPFMLVNDFLRGEVDYEVPFKLFHRSLRKTDKNLCLGEQIPSKL